MAITYPLTPPATPGPVEWSITPNQVAAVSTSPYSLTQQVHEHPGGRWEMSFRLPPMPRAIAEPWLAFLTALHGLVGTFVMGFPVMATPRGVATGTPLVNGANQSGFTLITDGWTPGVTGILLAGDWIQLGTGGFVHLHKVVQDVNSDGGGNAILDLWPRLRNFPADDGAVVKSNCKAQWRLAAPVGWDEDVVQHVGLSIGAVEVKS